MGAVEFGELFGEVGLFVVDVFRSCEVAFGKFFGGADVEDGGFGFGGE